MTSYVGLKQRTPLGIALVGMALIIQLAAFSGTGCSSSASPARPPARPPQPVSPEDVRVVDADGFDELRKSGKYVFSELLGEVSAAAPCASGSVDTECIEAAHQRLREAAAERGANLVVIVRSATLQSYPPRYSATGVLYMMSAR